MRFDMTSLERPLILKFGKIHRRNCCKIESVSQQALNSKRLLESRNIYLFPSVSHPDWCSWGFSFSRKSSMEIRHVNAFGAKQNFIDFKTFPMIHNIMNTNQNCFSLAQASSSSFQAVKFEIISSPCCSEVVAPFSKRCINCSLLLENDSK